MIKKIKEKIDIKKIKTPAMIVDTSVVENKYKNFKNLINEVDIFYSVKTNPCRRIIKTLADLQSGFEIASLNELKLLKEFKISPERIIVGNTLKVPAFIQEAYNYGINYFAFDSEVEIDKLAKLAPKTNVALRLSVDNTGSEWPLSKKFGAPASRAVELMNYAKRKNLNPNSLTFHVGSQCVNPISWSNALMVLAEVYNLSQRNGFNIEIINLGGGFPSRLDKNIPPLSFIGKNINKTIKDVFNGKILKFYIEPGRGIVGESAIFVSRVIAKADRGSESWISLDMGVYNGLLDAVAGIKFEIISDKEVNKKYKREDMISYHIGGPTCDSWDTITDNCFLPKDLNIGDIIYVLNSGAYTISLSTGFNGFEAPDVHFI